MPCLPDLRASSVTTWSVDGLHPTTSGYGVVAAEVLKVLTVAGNTSDSVEFADLPRRDALIEQPPP